MDIHIEPLIKNHPYYCIACENQIRNMVFEDGDTLPVNIAGIDPSLFYAAILWGKCPTCKETIYSIELTIASEKMRGAYLFTDHSHIAKNTASYSVFYQDQSWFVQHCMSVTDIPYCVHREIWTSPIEIDWMDIHFLPEFLFDPREGFLSPFEKGKALTEKIIPVLLEANLWD